MNYCNCKLHVFLSKSYTIFFHLKKIIHSFDRFSIPFANIIIKIPQIAEDTKLFLHSFKVAPSPLGSIKKVGCTILNIMILEMLRK